MNAFRSTLVTLVFALGFLAPASAVELKVATFAATSSQALVPGAQQQVLLGLTLMAIGGDVTVASIEPRQNGTVPLSEFQNIQLLDGGDQASPLIPVGVGNSLPLVTTSLVVPAGGMRTPVLKGDVKVTASAGTVQLTLLPADVKAYDTSGNPVAVTGSATLVNTIAVSGDVAVSLYPNPEASAPQMHEGTEWTVMVLKVTSINEGAKFETLPFLVNTSPDPSVRAASRSVAVVRIYDGNMQLLERAPIGSGTDVGLTEFTLIPNWVVSKDSSKLLTVKVLALHARDGGELGVPFYVHFLLNRATIRGEVSAIPIRKEGVVSSGPKTVVSESTSLPNPNAPPQGSSMITVRGTVTDLEKRFADVRVRLGLVRATYAQPAVPAVPAPIETSVGGGGGGGGGVPPVQSTTDPGVPVASDGRFATFLVAGENIPFDGSVSVMADVFLVGTSEKRLLSTASLTPVTGPEITLSPVIVAWAQDTALRYSSKLSVVSFGLEPVGGKSWTDLLFSAGATYFLRQTIRDGKSVVTPVFPNRKVDALRPGEAFVLPANGGGSIPYSGVAWAKDRRTIFFGEGLGLVSIPEREGFAGAVLPDLWDALVRAGLDPSMVGRYLSGFGFILWSPGFQTPEPSEKDPTRVSPFEFKSGEGAVVVIRKGGALDLNTLKVAYGSPSREIVGKKPKIVPIEEFLREVLNASEREQFAELTAEYKKQLVSPTPEKKNTGWGRIKLPAGVR